VSVPTIDNVPKNFSHFAFLLSGSVTTIAAGKSLALSPRSEKTVGDCGKFFSQ